jgi:hypothetical protein
MRVAMVGDNAGHTDDDRGDQDDETEYDNHVVLL